MAVVRLVVVQAPELDLQRAIRRSVDEGAVVRDQHQSRRSRSNEALQPTNRLDIQMVRRLVEEQDVRTLQEDLRQLDTHSPAAREFCRGAIEVRALKAQAKERLLDISLDAPRAMHEELVGALSVALDKLHIIRAIVVGTRRHLFGEALDFGLQLRDMAEDLLTLTEDGTLVARLHHLRQVADADPLRTTDDALRRLGNSSQELEEGGLPCPVLSHQSDTLLGGDDEREVFEEGLSPEIYRYVIDADHEE